MNILVTGAKGFVGRNLVESLKNICDGKDKTRKEIHIDNLYEYDVETDSALLKEYCSKADFVFHLAGVNRPVEEKEFQTGNVGFTQELLEILQQQSRNISIVLTSSTQAELDNPYGISKRNAEIAVLNYAQNTGSKVMIYRLPNLFGKWCHPNYNSVVATFCYNIAHDMDITLNLANPKVTLCYIDDVIHEFVTALNGQEYHDISKGNEAYCRVPESYTRPLHDIAALISSFRDSRIALSIPDMNDAFTKKLYSTYLSYLPENAFSYPLRMNLDNRGSFTEIIRTPERGQVSVNISRPGITKGNHWHHTKNEKFLVVSGQGMIRLRQIGSNEILEYPVSGEKLEVVDIPPGYTHNISNTGNSDLVTIMWANELFDTEKPDTYCEEV